VKEVWERGSLSLFETKCEKDVLTSMQKDHPKILLRSHQSCDQLLRRVLLLLRTSFQQHRPVLQVLDSKKVPLKVHLLEKIGYLTQPSERGEDHFDLLKIDELGSREETDLELLLAVVQCSRLIEELGDGSIEP